MLTKIVAAYSLVSKKKTVTVIWRDNALNETGCTVQRGTTANGPWTTVGMIGGGEPRFTVTYRDQTVTTGTYFYRVIANAHEFMA